MIMLLPFLLTMSLVTSSPHFHDDDDDGDDERFR